jgi:nucleoside-diphosphate kinase
MHTAINSHLPFIVFFCADYEDLKDKPFFPGLIKYMASGPVVAMVWQGLDAVKTGRVMLGATNPLASAPGTSCVVLCFFQVCLLNATGWIKKTGTIRGDFALAVGRNICHGSDSVDNAEKEIKLSVFTVYLTVMLA